jgi:hypothetical protein
LATYWSSSLKSGDLEKNSFKFWWLWAIFFIRNPLNRSKFGKISPRKKNRFSNEDFFEIALFRQWVQACCKNIAGFLIFSTFLTCNQIWLITSVLTSQNWKQKTLQLEAHHHDDDQATRENGLYSSGNKEKLPDKRTKEPMSTSNEKGDGLKETLWWHQIF